MVGYCVAQHVNGQMTMFRVYQIAAAILFLIPVKVDAFLDAS